MSLLKWRVWKVMFLALFVKWALQNNKKLVLKRLQIVLLQRLTIEDCPILLPKCKRHKWVFGQYCSHPRVILTVTASRERKFKLPWMHMDLFRYITRHFFLIFHRTWSTNLRLHFVYFSLIISQYPNIGFLWFLFLV